MLVELSETQLIILSNLVKNKLCGLDCDIANECSSFELFTTYTVLEEIECILSDESDRCQN